MIKRIINIALVFIVTFLLATVSFADTEINHIWFNLSEAKNLVVELETCRIDYKINLEYENLNKECKSQVSILEEIETNLKAQIESDKGFLDEKDRIINESRDVCQKLIKESQPTFIQRLSLFGIGALSGIIFVLLI